MTHRTRHPHGFTLIELMASIALVLLLILGVNQVFKIASGAVGAGQALSTAQRDNRSAQSVIYSDFRNMVTTGSPFFIIKSERVSAFRNNEDRLSDRDYPAAASLDQIDLAVRTVDNDANNSEADPIDATSVATISNRNHRVDSVRFFARDLFRRQTGNDGTFVSNIASQEAYICYGHLRQPAESPPTEALSGMATPRDPGVRQAGVTINTPANNPNNFYAQQWVLGRSVFVLREPEQVGSDFVILDNGVRQRYVGRSQTAAATTLSPWTEGATTTEDGRVFGSPVVQLNRFDVMGIGMQRAVDVFETAIRARTSPPNENWWDSVTYRFSGYPEPTKPHTSYGLARTAPVFIPGCSQFVVEYAGDFLTQPDPNTGEATAFAPDGTIDYVPIPTATGQPVGRRVRWYGFPRNVDTSDDDDTAAPNRVRIRGGTAAAAGGTNLIDVVPLRDVLMSFGFPESAPFEREMDPSKTGNFSGKLPAAANYAIPGIVPPNAEYVCAWGPPGTFHNWANATAAPGGRVYLPDSPLPRMLRFVIGIDDPQGRLNDPQFYEYVVELP